MPRFGERRMAMEAFRPSGYECVMCGEIDGLCSSVLVVGLGQALLRVSVTPTLPFLYGTYSVAFIARQALAEV